MCNQQGRIQEISDGVAQGGRKSRVRDGVSEDVILKKVCEHKCPSLIDRLGLRGGRARSRAAPLYPPLTSVYMDMFDMRINHTED